MSASLTTCLWFLKTYAAAATVGLLFIPATLGAQDLDAVEIRATKVTESIYMLEGAGGNIGVSVGEDGVFLIDDQFAPLTEKIKAAIAELTDKPVQFVINTHFHYDHTDGNENLGGEGAIIVAHDNSRTRMSSDQVIEFFKHNQAAYSPTGLPKITFAESMTFHYNGQTIDVFHTPNAHTDGDAIVHFREANVFHTGDVFVRYGLPFIDQPNGGSIDGLIAATYRMAGMANEETRFIPGHGQLSTKADLLTFAEMLITLRDRIQALIDEGKTLEEVIVADPTAGMEVTGLPVPGWIGLVYSDLSSSR
jgi:glyoxylase-like metal-dependent hydrolase (beta-lactamase superfamily II)